MSNEKKIKSALYWVVKRGYMPVLDIPEAKAEGMVADFRDGVPGFTQLYSVQTEGTQLQSARFYSVDEIYQMMVKEPEWK